MENQKIRDWYLQAYSDDDMGSELKRGITFYDLFVALEERKDVYDFLGAYDSIIRERIFKKLAEIMKVDYNYIYDQWLGA